jgi:hypothetical protein
LWIDHPTPGAVGTGLNSPPQIECEKAICQANGWYRRCTSSLQQSYIFFKLPKSTERKSKVIRVVCYEVVVNIMPQSGCLTGRIVDPDRDQGLKFLFQRLPQYKY